MTTTEFTTDQLKEIEEGRKAGIDVSVYENPGYLAIQMHEIRLGLLENLPVDIYAHPDFDWFQMEEIRKGMERKVDISKYADASIPFDVMRQIRKGLQAGVDLSGLKKLPAGILRQILKGMKAKVDILPYIKEGYEEEQLTQIRIALENGLPEIMDYISPILRGASIRQIRMGLDEKIDVSIYANPNYNWQQMRELRIGLREGLDVTPYRNQLYNWQQMQEIRLGLEENLPIKQYTSFMYTAKTMHEKRLELLEKQKKAGNNPEQLKKTYSAFELFIAENLMEASVFLHDREKKVNREALIEALQQNNVRKGIDFQIMDQICEGKSDRDIVVIASGKKPTTGEDGWYEFFFETDLKKNPILLEDGSVDYQNAKWFEMVKAGQKVAYYHVAEPGRPGYKINGEEIPARRGREQRYLTGEGFRLMPDRRTYLATIDGKIELKGDRLEITGLLVLNNVNIANGYVNFDGNVYVQGTVGSGSRISATRDIYVGGFTEGAVLEAGGDIILRKGNNADGKGYVKAKGDIRGVFFESARLISEGNIYANYCMSSELQAGGKVEISGRKGILVGGEVSAGTEILAYQIGNETGLATKLCLRTRDDVLKDEAALLQEEEKNRHELVLLQNAYQDFRRKHPEESRNVNPVYLKLENAIYTKELEQKMIADKKKELEKRKKKTQNHRIVAMGTMYSGVDVDINGLNWHSQELQNVVLREGDGYVRVEQLIPDK